jgi:hypothetical protein
MRAIKLSLILGGLFNITMGTIFFNNALLQWFFERTVSMEKIFFGQNVTLFAPVDPMHQLFIHGFGAGVLILGATLLYSSREPKRFVAFIFFDAIGRLIYGSTMVVFVYQYGLARMILIFAAIELTFAVAYLYGSWFLQSEQQNNRI